MGLHISGFTWNSDLTKIFFVVILIGIVSTLLQYHFIEEFLEFSKSDSSPYWKLLRNGFNIEAVILVVIYCWIQAGLSEEILFRGLIAKRLINTMGFRWGNVSQALIFWLLHFLLVGFKSDTWFSLFKFIVFISIFSISLLMGYANEKFCAGSIVASWILHSAMNFITTDILTLISGPVFEVFVFEGVKVCPN